MSESLPARASAASAILAAPFRPFYLAGTLSGILVLLLTGLYLGGIAAPISPTLPFALWHGHELLFGFAGAIVAGFILTALPGWAGTRELSRSNLLLLLLLWLAGRIAFALQAQLPGLLVAILDSSLFVVASALVYRDLVRANNHWYLTVLGIFAGFWLANLGFYLALADNDYPQASRMLRLALFAIIFKFVVVSGYLTLVFSNNVMAARKQPLIRVSAPLEILAITTVLLMLAARFWSLPAPGLILISLLAAAVHLLRLIRLRGWLMTGEPLLLAMNVAYGLMIVSFLLKAGYEAGWMTEDIWLHCFTVGAMGIMMLSLMTRVALRHTGRPLKLSLTGKRVFLLVIVAVLFRLGAGTDTPWLMSLSALLLCSTFVIYLRLYGPMLWTPSLPKRR